MSKVPDEFIDIHRRNNRQSASSWLEFADHRSRLTRLVSVGCPVGTDGRLAVLGAGNCNDLDLPELASRFREIHLLDVDEQALHRAKGKQLPDVAASLVLRAPIDLSGAFASLQDFRTARPSADQLSTLAETAVEHVAGALAGEAFDAVVSTCLLSQLMLGCRKALGPEHPDLAAVSHSIARAHLISLVRLARPGGGVVLATDICASTAYPELEDRWREMPPVDLVASLEATNHVFLGTRPSTILHVLASEAAIATKIEAPSAVEPWLWRMGPLVLLVYATSFRVRA